MFSRKLCDIRFNHISTYNAHQELHKDDENLIIFCAYSGCRQQYELYSSFRQHLYRNHYDDRVESKSSYNCSQNDCTFHTRDFRAMKIHLYRHFDSPHKGILCSFPNCFVPHKKFTTMNALKIHISRNHPYIVTGESTTNQIDVHSVSYLDSYETNFSNILMPDDARQRSDVMESKIDLIQTVTDPVKTLAGLYLDLKANHSATESILQSMIAGTRKVFEKCADSFISAVRSSKTFSHYQSTQIINMFQDNFRDIIEAHNSEYGLLRSTFTRKEYFRKNFNYIGPQEVNFNVPENEDQCHYQYVPILETLKQMLKNDNVRFYCLNPQSSTRDGFFDFIDGNFLKKYDFYNLNRNGLKIILYQDAFEVCNPIGSSKGKFKVTAVYMMLGNLPPHLRLKTINAKFVLLCLEKHVIKFGWPAVLEILIKDLNILANDGITLSFSGQEVTFKGTLIFMLGDNLGSHQIGGFTESFSKSKYFCRFCEILRSELKVNDYYEKEMRTIVRYTQDALQAETTEKMIKGIKRNSPLNRIESFHVCNPGLPPCIAHDLFEGFIQTDALYSIKYFIKKHWFRLGLLNYRLANVKLSTDSSSTNCILIIKETHKKLCGTASQIRRLIHILPVAIHDVIRDAYDPVWQLILRMREVCSLVCAPALSSGQLMLLHNKIEEYLQLRIKRFSDKQLSPKHHYLCHYPSFIEEMGPLHHLQTLRLESKHKSMKMKVKYSQNFKNITKSLAEKHQEVQSLNGNNYLTQVQFFDGAEYKYESYSNNVNSVIKAYFAEQIMTMCVSEKVTFMGIDYAKNMTICVGKSECGNFVMMQLFKVWSGNRAIKAFVVLQNVTVVELIAKSNDKMKIAGVRIALENDGTPVEDDEVLRLLSHETFLLLECGEVWQKIDVQTVAVIMEEPNARAPLAPIVNIENNLATVAQGLDNHDLVPNAQQMNNAADVLVLPFNNIEQNENENPALLQPILNPWSSYEYDWANIEPCIKQRLKNGERCFRLTTQVINRVVLNMRSVQTKIPVRVLRKVAQQIVKKYPDSFQDRIRDKKYSKGFVTFLDAMREHNNYLNRAERQRPPRNRRKTPIHIIKMMAQARMGTVNWEPVNYPDGETEATLEEKRMQLYEIFSALIIGEPIFENLQEDIFRQLKITYKSQRAFFNNFDEPQTPEDLSYSWPILLRKEFLFYHYELLMGHYIKLLGNNFLLEKESIFTYGSQKNLISSDKAEDYDVLQIIFKHFKEDPQNFLIDIPDGQAWTDLQFIQTGPIIARKSYEGGRYYDLIFDGTCFDGTNSFLEALQWGFATYFVWSRPYPSSYAHTLQFLQEVIVGLHVDDACKSTNSMKVRSRVNTLFKRLQKIGKFQRSIQN